MTSKPATSRRRVRRVFARLRPVAWAVALAWMCAMLAPADAGAAPPAPRSAVRAPGGSRDDRATRLRPAVGTPLSFPEPRVRPPARPGAPQTVPSASTATAPRMIDSYPRDGSDHILPDATLYFVFDEPTSKRGIFSVADLDSAGGTLLQLNAPTWSALGDTVFLKPVQPMALGHLHGMRVNLVFSPLPDTLASVDLPIVYFRTIAVAKLQRVSAPASITLVPGEPTPVATSFQETASDAVTITSAHIQMWPDTTTAGAPAVDQTVPVDYVIPRLGQATLSVLVTVPPDLARSSPDGRIGLRITYSGIDETRTPHQVEAFAGGVGLAALTPSLAGNAVIRSAVLEWPLPGAAFGAGDTLRPRAVVIGDGTGYFRSVFYMDGDVVAVEEGFMESGRPVTVETRGPIPTRRFGEHRLQFVVESPQNVASQPITFLSLPPANGLTPRGPAAPPASPDSARFDLQSTFLADGRSSFGAEESAVTGWAALHGRYALSPTQSLEARVTSRVRFDDVKNGSASPDQVLVRYQSQRAALEWGDLAPALANGAPLFASAIPRRGAQALLSDSRLGTFEGFAAVESHPRSAGGPLREIRSDLYAARLTRVFVPDRLRASLYGGYTHEDPTPGGLETATRTRVIYGGSASWMVAHDWTLLGDAVTVRHRTIEGVEPGRTRTGVRGELTGTAARFTARAEAFRYQPSLATALNPYAISDRKGFSADLARSVGPSRAFAGYRRESPEDASSGAPSVTAEKMTAGATLALNRDSWVTPSIIRIRQKGTQTDFSQTRLATEFTASEAMGGRTTARFDFGTFDDDKGLSMRRRVLAGSVVSVRRHPGGVTSTISGGIERDENRDVSKRDMTIQGALEVRWEASPSRLLVQPFVTYISRDYELQGRSEDRLTGRLQISLLRLPGLGDAALSVQGRFERVWHKVPEGTHATDTGVEVSLGKRVSILP
ncbi:MAG: hypothetical protein ACM3PF_09130 [Bacteroidota bacterium]